MAISGKKENCFQVAKFTPKGVSGRRNHLMLAAVRAGSDPFQVTRSVKWNSQPKETGIFISLPVSSGIRTAVPGRQPLHSVILQPDRRCSFHQTFHKAHDMRA